MKHTCVHITTYGYCILYIGYARFMRDYSYLGPECKAQGIQTAVMPQNSALHFKTIS